MKLAIQLSIFQISIKLTFVTQALINLEQSMTVLLNECVSYYKAVSLLSKLTLRLGGRCSSPGVPSKVHCPSDSAGSSLNRCTKLAVNMYNMVRAIRDAGHSLLPVANQTQGKICFKKCGKNPDSC